MAEWHIPPDHIVGSWTDELLNLMVEKMVERKAKLRLPREREQVGVSPDTFFTQARNLFKRVVKHGD